MQAIGPSSTSINVSISLIKPGAAAPFITTITTSSRHTDNPPHKLVVDQVREKPVQVGNLAFVEPEAEALPAQNKPADISEALNGIVVGETREEPAVVEVQNTVEPVAAILPREGWNPEHPEEYGPWYGFCMMEPFASLLIHGGITIESRKWKWSREAFNKCIGRTLVIQAHTSWFDKVGVVNEMCKNPNHPYGYVGTRLRRAGVLKPGILATKQLRRGVALGVATLSNVLPAPDAGRRLLEVGGERAQEELESGTWQDGHWALVFSNRRIFATPVDGTKGERNLYTLEENTRHNVRRALSLE